MDGGVTVEGAYLGPVSRLANKEFVKTPSPSPPASPESSTDEEACRVELYLAARDISPPTSTDEEEERGVELHLAALDMSCEEGKKLDLPSESPGSKTAVAAVVSPSPSKQASHRVYKPLDFFDDVLDMLAEGGMDLGESSPAAATGHRDEAAETAAKIRKNPWGCRQRNVVRRDSISFFASDMVLSWAKDHPELRADLETFLGVPEAKRLEYLKTAV